MTFQTFMSYDEKWAGPKSVSGTMEAVVSDVVAPEDLLVSSLVIKPLSLLKHTRKDISDSN